MPAFRRLADELRREFAHVTAHVWSSPVGSATALQGHSLGVDCVIKDAPADAADCVALSVELAYLTSRPQLTAADVCWGHPSGRYEAALIADPLDLSDAVIQKVKVELPSLERALKEAVARRAPKP